MTRGMAKQKDVLKKIVALKRQGAEQRLLILQTEAERIEAAIRQMRAGLATMDNTTAGFDALWLAEQNGHVRKVISDINAAQAALAMKQTEVSEAREALKRAFHSENRLGEITAKG